MNAANCCPNLETMFLGSNNPRSLNPGVFRHWPKLSFLTLENIMVENIVHCLEVGFCYTFSSVENNASSFSGGWFSAPWIEDSVQWLRPERYRGAVS